MSRMCRQDPENEHTEYPNQQPAGYARYRRLGAPAVRGGVVGGERPNVRSACFWRPGTLWPGVYDGDEGGPGRGIAEYGASIPAYL